MKLTYTVSQVIDTKDGKKYWYAHNVRCPYCPCMIEGNPTFGTKKQALQNAALMMCLPYKEYMELRRKS